MKLPTKDSKPPKVGKAPLAILPAKPLRAIASAFAHGLAKGYEAWSWTAPRDEWKREYGSAAMRHLTSYLDPTEPDEDEESGLSHLAHLGACVMILLWREGVDFQTSAIVAPTPPRSDTTIESTRPEDYPR